MTDAGGSVADLLYLKEGHAGRRSSISISWNGLKKIAVGRPVRATDAASRSSGIHRVEPQKPRLIARC